MEGVVVLAVIIDKTGAVVRPEIIRPIGLGLDEQAITPSAPGSSSRYARWQTVAVEKRIEVTFNLG